MTWEKVLEGSAFLLQLRLLVLGSEHTGSSGPARGTEAASPVSAHRGARRAGWAGCTGYPSPQPDASSRGLNHGCLSSAQPTRVPLQTQPRSCFHLSPSSEVPTATPFRAKPTASLQALALPATLTPRCLPAPKFSCLGSTEKTHCPSLLLNLPFPRLFLSQSSSFLPATWAGGDVTSLSLLLYGRVSLFNLTVAIMW